MPDLTFTAALAWFTVLASAASVGSLSLGLLLWWQNRATSTDVHAALQITLGDIGKAVADSHRQHEQTLAQIGQVLQAMDRAAEQRHQDVKDRLDGTER